MWNIQDFWKLRRAICFAKGVGSPVHHHLGNVYFIAGILLELSSNRAASIQVSECWEQTTHGCLKCFGLRDPLDTRF